MRVNVGTERFEHDSFSKILDKISFLANKKKRVIVLVTGNSRSGKTTLSKEIHDNLSASGVQSQEIHLDDWILPVSKRTTSMSLAERLNIDELEGDIVRLFKGEELIIYPYVQSTREKSSNIKKINLISEGVVIFEGVQSGFVSKLISLKDIIVFVDIEEGNRKNRIFSFYRSKGLTSSKIEELYLERTEDEYCIIEEHKKIADLVYYGGIRNE